MTKSRAGFGLLEIVIALGLLVGATMALLSMGKILNKQQVQSNVAFTADEIRRNLVSYLRHPAAWQRTLADTTNSNLACLRTNSTCTGQNGTFAIRNAANGVVYDPRVATNGFTVSGAPCNSFNSASGNNACPFRMNVAWNPLCAGACIAPQIRIEGTLIYRPASSANTPTLNTSNYGFEIVLDSGPAGAGTYFHVDLNGVNQGLVPNVDSRINFPREMRDTLNEFNPANSRFTPSSAGLYQLSGCIGLNLGINPCAGRAWIRKNGVGHRLIGTEVMVPGWNFHYLNFSITVEAVAGDYFDFFAFHNCPAASVVGNVTATYLTVVRLR